MYLCVYTKKQHKQTFRKGLFVLYCKTNVVINMFHVPPRTPYPDQGALLHILNIY